MKKSIFFLFFVLISPHVKAAEISGVWFNDYYLDQGHYMQLQGTGVKSLLFFKAFAAGFYMGEGHQSDLLGNFPKRIEVQYFVRIPGKDLNNFTVQKIKDNISQHDLDSLKDQIGEMEKYFVNLEPGDRFSLTYIPNIGTKFEHNGQLIGIIKGNEFARAIFSVWIGKKPFDHQLKKQVLGLK